MLLDLPESLGLGELESRSGAWTSSLEDVEEEHS